jgi:ketosteroid isomerase-like protein
MAELPARKDLAGGRKVQDNVKFGEEERTMKGNVFSRRKLLAAGGCTLVGGIGGWAAVGAPTLAEPGSANEEIIRKWYMVWEKKDLQTFDAMLADNFTFTSANDDDHISKSAFKTQCWDTQVDFIAHFELERITTGPDDAFVKYLCHTRNGKSFRNVEYLRIRNGKLESIECYFGAKSSFPSAVSSGKK